MNGNAMELHCTTREINGLTGKPCPPKAEVAGSNPAGSASFPATFRRHRAVRPGTNVPVGMAAHGANPEAV